MRRHIIIFKITFRNLFYNLKIIFHNIMAKHLFVQQGYRAALKRISKNFSEWELHSKPQDNLNATPRNKIFMK